MSTRKAARLEQLITLIVTRAAQEGYKGKISGAFPGEWSTILRLVDAEETRPPDMIVSKSLYSQFNKGDVITMKVDGQSSQFTVSNIQNKGTDKIKLWIQPDPKKKTEDRTVNVDWTTY